MIFRLSTVLLLAIISSNNVNVSAQRPNLRTRMLATVEPSVVSTSWGTTDMPEDASTPMPSEDASTDMPSEEKASTDMPTEDASTQMPSEGASTEAPSDTESPITRDFNATEAPRDFNATEAPDVTESPTEAPIDVDDMDEDEPEPEPEPAPTTPPVKKDGDKFLDQGIEIPITTRVEFTYFNKNGLGGDLDVSSDVALDLIEQFNVFEELVLMDAEVFGEYFAGMKEKGLVSSWDEATKTLTLEFSALVYLENQAGQWDHTIAKVMAAGDFHKLLANLKEVAGLKGGEYKKFFAGIQQVQFTSYGTSERR